MSLHRLACCCNVVILVAGGSTNPAGGRGLIGVEDSGTGFDEIRNYAGFNSYDSVRMTSKYAAAIQTNAVGGSGPVVVWNIEQTPLYKWTTNPGTPASNWTRVFIQGKYAYMCGRSSTFGGAHLQKRNISDGSVVWSYTSATIPLSSVGRALWVKPDGTVFLALDGSDLLETIDSNGTFVSSFALGNQGVSDMWVLDGGEGDMVFSYLGGPVGSPILERTTQAGVSVWQVSGSPAGVAGVGNVVKISINSLQNRIAAVVNQYSGFVLFMSATAVYDLDGNLLYNKIPEGTPTGGASFNINGIDWTRSGQLYMVGAKRTSGTYNGKNCWRTLENGTVVWSDVENGPGPGTPFLADVCTTIRR